MQTTDKRSWIKLQFTQHSQMVEWLAEDLELLKEHSLDKVGLNESEPVSGSIIMAGPLAVKSTKEKFPEIKENQILYCETASGYLFPVWKVIVLHICENFFFICEGFYNWPENQIYTFSESQLVSGWFIGKYSYRDIADVTIEQRTGKVESEITNPFSKGVLFEINLKDGVYITVFTPDSFTGLISNAYYAAQGLQRIQAEIAQRIQAEIALKK